jgi:hypothetical protein
MLKSAIFCVVRKNEKNNSIFGILTVGSCTRLLQRTCAKKFKKVYHTDCEIITFEVERKVFFTCPRQGQHTLTARGAKFLNYATLSFCTIVMHIMLGTCVPNLRGRWWMEHTQMHHCTLQWRRVQKISITLTILEEFFVISIFCETKIPTVNMKV